MDFTLTDDQRLLVDSVSSLLHGACPPARVRAVAEGDRAAARVPALADFVALGDGPVTDHVLVAERVGRHCTPGPWFVSSALALPLLRAAGHDLADAVADGDVVATVAWAGSDGVWSDIVGSVDGRYTFVLDHDLSDVVVRLNGAKVQLDDPASVHRIGWLDLTRTAWALDYRPMASHLLGLDLVPILERATVVLAAELCGTARHLLDLAVAYARERVQFDVPIGSFQAVQHLLADLALDVERAWAAIQWAAMCLDEPSAAGPDARRAPSIAKAAASEAAVRSATTSIQVHGGIGYTWEHDLHLWIRRARTTAHLLGTADEHHDRLALLDMT